jgi:prevent-host-death family protein
VPTIPQRELRNQVSDVLRRAENGEHFTVTVDGRPVAQVTPLSPGRRPAPGHRLEEVLAAAPVDSGWAGDLRRQRAEDRHAARDPWAG